MQPKPMSENSPGPPGGGYGGDKAREQWKGGDVKKRWDGVADRFYSQHARVRARVHHSLLQIHAIRSMCPGVRYTALFFESEGLGEGTVRQVVCVNLV